MSLFRQVLKRALTVALPERWWRVLGPHACGQVALTFDDGPDPQRTPQILDILHQFGIQATFFVVGRKAAQYPDIIRRIAEEGHDLGNHSYFHGEPSQTPANQLLTEVSACRSLLKRLTKRDVQFFRPPKGELSLKKILGLWQRRQAVVLWNVDPRDYTFSHTEQFEKWSQQYAPTAGDIILLHDNRKVTMEGLPFLLERIQQAGLGFCPISAWCGPRGTVQKLATAGGAP